MSASRPGIRFSFEWRITLFTALMIPVLISLGFWQLSRAEEKVALASAFEERQAMRPATPAAMASLDAAELAYRPAFARGEYQPGRYFLLDNRTRNGRFGYEVLHVLRLYTGDTLLINRGWVAGDPARQALPTVPEVSGTVELTGHIYVAPGKPYLLAAQQLTQGWPKRVQAVEMDLFKSAIEDGASGRLFPYPLRLDDDQPGALDIDWQFINVSPAKHTGYAVQWFTMAAVLGLVFLFQSSNLWLVLRGKNDNGVNND